MIASPVCPTSGEVARRRQRGQESQGPALLSFPFLSLLPHFNLSLDTTPQQSWIESLIDQIFQVSVLSAPKIALKREFSELKEEIFLLS